MRLVATLSTDLERWQRSVDTQDREGWPSIESLLQRLLIAQALGEQALVASYYDLVRRVRWPSVSLVEDPDRAYATGLAALAANDLSSAREQFTVATELYARLHGPSDARSVAAQYNLANTLLRLRLVDEARGAYRSALANATQGLGVKHQQTAAIAFELAALFPVPSPERSSLLHLAEEAYGKVESDDGPRLAAVRRELARPDA
jgi:tetratricopeptide (TPR) repeat protein